MVKKFLIRALLYVAECLGLLFLFIREVIHDMMPGIKKEMRGVLNAQIRYLTIAIFNLAALIVFFLSLPYILKWFFSFP